MSEIKKTEFKTESKKLLDMMINSIYTHKEIFLRELISNASDAIDKMYFRSLTDDQVSLNRSDFEIRIGVDKDRRQIVISDNGCGMTRDELENNLGTIAKSGSFEFKNESKENSSKPEDIDIIGQFGVGFYSAFMVSDDIQVVSRAFGDDKAYLWESTGVDGYTVTPCVKDSHGTVITLHIKEDTEDENYSEFLEEYRIRSLVKKYSDYIRYPIRMKVTKSRRKEGTPEDKPEYESYQEDETLNSMIPIWKKAQSEVTDEEYASFYKEKYYDYEDPIKVITQRTEGMTNYDALLFIPSHAPFNYYSREFEKGLQLYSSGVMIMEKCKDLLPDYFSFVTGLVDSQDLSLNISREMLQHDRQLKRIAQAIEKKIAGELSKMLKNERDKYETFYKAFGTQLKYGVYSDYGMHKEVLQDLLMFRSSFGDSPVTLEEYTGRMKEGQEKIYFAAGDTEDQIALIPQVEAVTEKGYEVLYLTEDIDEFALQMLMRYKEHEFLNVCRDGLDLATQEEKDKLKKENEDNSEMLTFMKDSIGDSVKAVRFTNTLKDHPVAISSEGNLSVGMEKTLNRMPGAEDNKVRADLVMEINIDHPIAAKLKELFENDKDRLASYSKILNANARLISGLSLSNASEIAGLVCDLML